MIKCPECGQQVSDRAPVCPNCGAEIAGKVTTCPQCGEVYFKDQEMCPKCHHLTGAPITPEYVEKKTAETPKLAEPHRKDKKRNHTPLIIALVIALVIAAGCYYFYSNSMTNKEADAYEYALKSDDPIVLQTYLNNYKDAPEDHINAIADKLNSLKQVDRDWDNALVSGSKQALLDYLSKYPDSEHKGEVMDKIDSIDWAEASSTNSIASYQEYLAVHPDGRHIDEADEAMKKIKAKTVQPEDRQIAKSALRKFFQAVNSKDEVALEASVTPVLTSFLGKPEATQDDVVTFMHKIYKEDITNMNWRLGDISKINKKEVGEDEYQYTVNITATQTVEYTDKEKNKTNKFKITALVNPEGLINSMSMTKILE